MTDELKENKNRNQFSGQARNVIPHPASGGDLDDMRRRVEERKKPGIVKFDRGDTGGDIGSDSVFIQDCLKANEQGDGDLFRRLWPNRYMFNKSMDCWMRWDGHHWEIDVMFIVVEAVDQMVACYLKKIVRVSGEILEIFGKEDIRFQCYKLRAS